MAQNTPTSTPVTLDIVSCSVQDLLNATDEALRDSLATRNVSVAADAERKDLLLSAIQLREAAQQNQTVSTPQAAMERILSMSASDINKTSAADPVSFLALMNLAHSFDSSLPKPPQTDAIHILANAAMTWKLITLESTNAGPPIAPHATPVADAPPPLPAPADLMQILETGNSNGGEEAVDSGLSREPPRKRAKTVSVGGVVIVDEQGKSTPNRPPILGPYPGKATSVISLCVTELIAGKLLKGLLMRGRCLEAAVSQVQWHRGQRGEVLAAEAEAYTLGRILHLALHEENTMESALEKFAWMEVAIRRLYALMYVENNVRTMSIPRSVAWTAANPILESNPGAPNLLPEFDTTIARNLAMNAKAHNAFKSMKSIQSRNPRPQRRDHQDASKENKRQ